MCEPKFSEICCERTGGMESQTEIHCKLFSETLQNPVIPLTSVRFMIYNIYV